MGMQTWRHRGTALFGATLALSVFLPGAAGATTAEEDMAWTGGLRSAYFADREIRSDHVITLDAPTRAENAAIVPITIRAGIPQTADQYIRTIWLFVDKNPGPLVGKFDFTPASGRADLGLRLRVDTYSPVRAIAETSDGQLHMARQFVKASGGCSAPASSSSEEAAKQLGKMKFLMHQDNGEKNAGDVEQRTIAQLMIRHPNRSGLQMDQVTRHYTPADFIRQVKVSFEGQEILSAETSFAISENPSFRFYFSPQREGELEARVIDTEGREFVETYKVSPGAGAAPAEDALRNR